MPTQRRRPARPNAGPPLADQIAALPVSAAAFNELHAIAAAVLAEHGELDDAKPDNDEG